ncbi:hypothetical protein GGR25_004551 [Kaistia hirudinis]|uniref:Uncharacterized protein n=1 Tax=Kaistia hirudinis TaxID=1293440 RepID=A0A840AWF3_9HYPH|nr:hypothetical protein [Kaistia hirudinis]MBB3933478.1 hypothetical protein [Kaistia hirudinis]MBN9020293.1 hypothetical protein [Hyphomicrobiales bacterium]
MAKDLAAIAELEKRIAVVRANIIELTEQAAAYSGAADDDLASRRIEMQQRELDELTRELDALQAE